MKERIITILKGAALGDEGTLKVLLPMLSLPKEELIRRADDCLQQILHHYSDFNVRTIDSFLTTVYKASSMELGVQPDVEVEFDSDAVVNQAFRQYSQQLREGSPEARFVDDIIALIERNDYGTGGYLWNPFSKIVREVRQLQKELGRYSHDPLELEGKDQLDILHRRIVEQANTLKRLIEQTTLPVYAHFKNEILKLSRGEVFEIASRGKTKRYFNKFSDDAGAEREVKKLFRVIRPMEEDLEEYVKIYSHTYYQPFVQAVKLIGQKMREVKLLDGTVVLDDINRSLAHYLSSNVIPEVYLKLGERISHFMIDEFQDTSPIQWKNLTPLIEEALSKQGSLFAVGDTKQSIYGFRGADWHIFRNLIENKYFPSAPAEVLPLTTNYRSAQALVDFVKEVFSENASRAGFEEHARASGLYNFAQDVPDKEKGKGYVEVRLMEKSEDDSVAHIQQKYILSTIMDCVSRGYSHGDIAILTPANADVVEISSWLNSAQIPFISLSTLDIRKRKIIAEVIAFLRFLDSPIDELSFYTFLSGEIMQGNITDWTVEKLHRLAVDVRSKKDASAYRIFRDQYPQIWEQYFERLFTVVGYLPLYDIVSEVYKAFSLFEHFAQEESALVKLLECVKQFERSGSNSLKDFLSFSTEDGSDPWSIDIPGSVHAVRVMTVHKAKGLGFPIVIVSLSEKRSQTRSMITLETDDGVSVLRVGKNYGERNEALGNIYTEKGKELIIDELNKIYVALTRARKEMYVIGTYKSREHLPAAILNEKSYGRKYPVAEKEPAVEKLPRIASLYHKESILLVSTTSKTIGVEELRRGDMIHAILSHIEYIIGTGEEEVQKAMSMVEGMTGFNTDAEKLNLLRFLALPEVRQYFEIKQGRRVLCEQDIVASNGRLFRLDRMIVDVDHVTVVDYKTGSDEHHSEYEAQLQNYMKLVKDLYPGKTVAGALLYIDRQKGVPVS